MATGEDRALFRLGVGLHTTCGLDLPTRGTLIEADALASTRYRGQARTADPLLGRWQARTADPLLGRCLAAAEMSAVRASHWQPRRRHYVLYWTPRG